MSGYILIATDATTGVFIMLYVKYSIGLVVDCLVQCLFYTPEKFGACAWACETAVKKTENNSHIFSYCHAEFGTCIRKGIIMLGSCKGIHNLLEHKN
jgi:hypothetical protein